MTEHIPLVIETPHFRGQLNQDGSWTITGDVRADGLGDPARLIAEKILAEKPANNTAPDNSTPFSIEDAMQVALADPVVSDWVRAMGPLKCSIPPRGSISLHVGYMIVQHDLHH